VSSQAGPPSGTVTFLFTDIEGSTRLLKRLREGYGDVLAEHQELLRAAFAASHGTEVDTQGDSFFVAFRRAKDAVEAAASGQRALQSHAWPDGGEVRVRMGIHTGQAETSGGRYLGLAVHRAARIGNSGHGGQVLVSQTTRDLLDDEEEESAGIILHDLGEQRLKDLDRPVRLYQLDVEGLPSEFPPLRALAPAPQEELAVMGPSAWSRRLQLLVPIALVVVASVIAAIVVLTRRDSGSAQASAGVAADSVGVFQAANGKPLAQAQVGSGPSAVAADETAIWVANVDDDSVSRIDPETNASVQTIPVGNGPSGVAVGGGFVWVANALDGTISRIDPNANGGSGGVVDTIPVGIRPTGVAFGEGSVWVANAGDRTIMRLDATTGRPRKTIPVDAGADGVAADMGAIWVTSESKGSLARIDPRAGSVIRTINVGSGAGAVAVGAGAVWVANGSDGTVSRVDLTLNRQTAVIPVGEAPGGVTATEKYVWVSNETGGTLSRIDPARDKVVQTVPTGNRPEGVAVSGDTIYVAVRSSGLAHRGGTLTMIGGSFGSVPSEAPLFDPADPGYGALWGLSVVTNDGLVAYRRVGGSDGVRLVSDLAVSLPAPTDGGRTYTFQLRPRHRYSTGTLVRAADFRRPIERALAHPGGLGATFYTSIVGAKACTKAPKRCDLSRGIVDDPVANTVTFKLTAPDPDLLYKLALPPAFAVPASTPLFDAQLPLPATGPYRVASYSHGRKRGQLRLVRNPQFQEWSAAAQPDGNPDEIVWKLGPEGKAALRAIERGTADLTQNVRVAVVPALRTRYEPQLHITPATETSYVSLNTKLPPFDDLRVRQAVNFAVDRDRLVELKGGPDLSRPSCQVLPPNLDGYRRYCPYTLQRPDGRYGGPDLARARRLVAASGTKGQAITVWTCTCLAAARGAYIVSVLRSLGYKARLKSVEELSAYGAAARRPTVQAHIQGWYADYPSADDFFYPLLTCAFQNGSEEFCNPTIDAEIARARALQVSDPRAASKLWSKIDREIVDLAPWVVESNAQNVDFVSRRVGNYQVNPEWGVLVDQLWVR
jgi:YVTN family beta-propeller protein